MCPETRVVRRASVGVSARARHAWRRAKSGVSAALRRSRQVSSWKWRWRAPECGATRREIHPPLPTRDVREVNPANAPAARETARCLRVSFSKAAWRSAGRVSRRWRGGGSNARVSVCDDEETANEENRGTVGAVGVDVHDFVAHVTDDPVSMTTEPWVPLTPVSNPNKPSPTTPVSRERVPGAVASPAMSPAKNKTGPRVPEKPAVRVSGGEAKHSWTAFPEHHETMALETTDGTHGKGVLEEAIPFTTHDETKHAHHAYTKARSQPPEIVKEMSVSYGQSVRGMW